LRGSAPSTAKAWGEGGINRQPPWERWHLADIRGYGLLGGERDPPGSAHLIDTCRLEGGAPGDGLLQHPHQERICPERSEKVWGEGDINWQPPWERWHLAGIRGYELLGGERGPPGSAHLTDTCRLEGGAPGDGLLRHPFMKPPVGNGLRAVPKNLHQIPERHGGRSLWKIKVKWGTRAC